MARLLSYVYVTDADGNPVGFGPGDDLPEWAVEQIGEHCFADGEKPKAPAKRTATRSEK